jgi:N-dimethylarginine dimethylaminohydrolase
VKPFQIEHDFSGDFSPAKHNLLYVRDLFFATPKGAVVSKMKGAVRAGEEKHAARALGQLGVPILKSISGRGTFEGADALWLNPKTVLCGVGNRTNAAGFRQLRGVLKKQGVKTVAVAVPRGVQHLLGMLQLVDRDLAFVRTEVAPENLKTLLARGGVRVVPVPETEETTRRQGMNLVTVAPRKVVMAKHCPVLKRLYEKAGVTVAAELEIGQFIRGAGGLACAVGILARRA